MLFKLLFTASLFVLACAYSETDPVDRTLDFAKRHQEFKNLFFKQHESEFIRLVEKGQNPHTLFIGCSDSRVVPSLILKSNPGELFSINTAGNFVPPYDPKCADGVVASVQYAIEVVNVKHIIVCGHSHCGAIKGLFEKLDPSLLNYVQSWIKLGEPAKRMALLTNPNANKEDLYRVTEEISVIFQLENLLSYPFVKQRVEKGTLELHGWYYIIETGEIKFYDWKEYSFKPLSSLLEPAAIQASGPQ